MVSEWREAVVEHLASAFPDAEVLSGRRAGVSRDRDRIAVFWPGWRASQRDYTLATPSLTIRYWPARSKQPSTTSPPDPAVLEDAGVALMLAFRNTRKAGDFVDGLACWLDEVAPDYDDEEWKVEAVLKAVALNPAVAAA